MPCPRSSANGDRPTRNSSSASVTTSCRDRASVWISWTPSIGEVRPSGPERFAHPGSDDGRSSPSHARRFGRDRIRGGTAPKSADHEGRRAGLAPGRPARRPPPRRRETDTHVSYIHVCKVAALAQVSTPSAACLLRTRRHRRRPRPSSRLGVRGWPRTAPRRPRAAPDRQVDRRRPFRPALRDALRVHGRHAGGRCPRSAGRRDARIRRVRAAASRDGRPLHGTPLLLAGMAERH